MLISHCKLEIELDNIDVLKEENEIETDFWINNDKEKYISRRLENEQR